ncbi:SulP family inorganic anion transporter [Streptomyces sp. NPDC060064]|uniref:SulP family inorganic anion transporter n=1 Tax=Streptomyces sp. NPDC060064 TaxID=3347049 RepID=UPI0036B217DB
MNTSHGTAPLLHRLMPGLALLAGYRRSDLRGDLIAGVTVAAYLIPQVMAYASLAGLPPISGLWAALPCLAVYALLGSSRQLSVGPESTTALMTAVVVGPLAAGDAGRYATLASALAVVVGLLCLAAFAARLGFVADLLSRPILVGYMAGVGLIMIVDQLPKLAGVPAGGTSFAEQLGSFVTGLSQVHTATLTLSAVALGLLLLMQWRVPNVPASLVVVVLATAAVSAFDLEQFGIRVIGDVPAGLPSPELPDLGDLSDLALPAVGVLLVGYTDVILTARAFASRKGESIDTNQELLALGASNIGAGVLHGFPVSSSASRTALADAAGGRTQIYSLTALAGLLAVLLFLSPVLANFPVAVLAAIVVYAALRLIDLRAFQRLASFRRSELLLAVSSLAGVLAFDILYGVLLAVGLSVAEMLARVARPHDAVQGLVAGLAGMHDVDDYPQAHTIPGLVVYRYDSPLFFANAQDFQRRALAAVDDHQGPVAWFVLNTEANVEVDITAMDSLEELRRRLVAQGIVFALARVKQDLRNDLDAYGFTDSIGADLMFPTLPTALEAYHDWLRHNAPPTGPEMA